MSTRKSDDNQSEVEHRRATSRILCRDGQWFFASREGEFGPFDSEELAQQELDAYVNLVDLTADKESPVTPDEPERRQIG